MIQNLNEELFSFIKKSPTGFHAVHELANYLTEAGFECLAEGNTWNLAEGGKYFVTRNQSAIIAFKVSRKDYSGFHIAASHSDSPTLKIKESSEMNIENQYVKLNVEKYGGMLCAPWFDRPLSVAGRIIVKDGNRLTTKLINVDRDLLMIPNLAIHMNREVNDGYKYNIQKDMLPLYRMSNSGKAFKEMIAEEAGVSVDQIKGMDLFLYNRMEGTVWGCDGEFISAPRLDDLQCAFTSTMALLNSESDRCIPVVAVFDNEEVGSGTKQGAGSTFLYDILRRINRSLGRTEEEYLTSLASSFMVSADNGHAVHPNYADKTDPTNRTYLNGGLVIKHSANQKYTTDAVSAAVMRCLCERAGVPYQEFLNRSDILGGSTLGNISNAQVSLNTVLQAPRIWPTWKRHLKSSSNPRSVLRATVRLYLSNSDNKILRKYSCFRWIFYPSSPDERTERFFLPSATWKNSFSVYLRVAASDSEIFLPRFVSTASNLLGTASISARIALIFLSIPSILASIRSSFSFVSTHLAFSSCICLVMLIRFFFISALRLFSTLSIFSPVRASDATISARIRPSDAINFSSIRSEICFISSFVKVSLLHFFRPHW